MAVDRYTGIEPPERDAWDEWEEMHPPDRPDLWPSGAVKEDDHEEHVTRCSWYVIVCARCRRLLWLAGTDPDRAPIEASRHGWAVVRGNWVCSACAMNAARREATG